MCVLAASQQPIAAAPVTFLFTGTVTQINTDPSDPFGGSIGFGTGLTGSFTFDSNAVDGVPDPSTGSYSSTGAPFRLEMAIAGFPFLADTSVNIGIANDFGGSLDQYTVFATGAGGLSVSILFQDFTGSVFGGDALPLTPPEVASFLTRTFLVDAKVGGNQVQIDGTIDSLTAATQIPEPATYFAAGAGLVLVVLRKYRRKKN